MIAESQTFNAFDLALPALEDRVRCKMMKH